MTEVRTVFNIVLGKKIPSVSVKKAWRDEWTDVWVGGVTVSPNELMEGDSRVHGAPLLPHH